MDYFAVMGNPVAHSLSPLIHQLFAKQTGIVLHYDKILVPHALFEQQVHQFFTHQQGKGLNITLPFKERAYAMAAVRSARCLEVGSANTLWMKNRLLHADNTDGIGLIRDLKHHITLHRKKILVLGAGGAARGIISALQKEELSSLSISNRTHNKALSLKTLFPAIDILPLAELKSNYDIIINATAASLNNQCPQLPQTILDNHPFCYDLAYTQNGRTPFVNWANTHGSTAIDGIGMLIEQAAESFYIWHGVKPSTKDVKHLIQFK